MTGAPSPASIGAFSGYEWEPLASKQVVYTTDDGHIHELFVQVEGSWGHADLTQMTGAPPTFDSFSFAGYQWRLQVSTWEPIATFTSYSFQWEALGVMLT